MTSVAPASGAPASSVSVAVKGTGSPALPEAGALSVRLVAGSGSAAPTGPAGPSTAASASTTDGARMRTQDAEVFTRSLRVGTQTVLLH